jgi:5-methyltetrahydrofolate--homocysteine methyltransferase
LRQKVKFLVGGTAVTKVFADSIEADGYAPDAGLAVAVTKFLMTPTGKL